MLFRRTQFVDSLGEGNIWTNDTVYSVYYEESHLPILVYQDGGCRKDS